MPSRPPGDNEGARVGGARADFVASLGRKLNDARDLLALLEEDPASSDGRDELRRRLHALGSGARLLRFDAMTHSLQEALAVLDRGAQGGGLREEDVDFVAQVLDDLPALAWGEVRSRDAGAAGGGVDTANDTRGPVPVAALVVGDDALAEALGDDGPAQARVFECERTEDTDAALGLARAHAPDVIVVDADLPKARELIEALLDDPLTDPVPVVLVGAFPTQEELARYVALGVARALTKPVGPELLRATCDELVDHRDGRTVRMTLGEPTLEQLADRLADELRRALVDGVDTPARSHRVPLGEGTEVLGALWGAIARVQEIVTHKTGGGIRFGGETPEGAIALAPWLQQEVSGADRVPGRGRGAAAEVRLDGRRVVVADDDPGVTWFVSDLLRTAGCDVHEALDGTTALSLAFRLQPELVVSDILMPGIDGFALCRALRRDVALRDTPVILLSWKEDLLQRVRELGASAAAYMRKESGSRAILARVREVLRPRARIESRLRAEGEVRGRLDGLTPRVLLELVCSIRDDARLSIRDATYLYEVEVRAGAPRKVTRTATDGGYRSGERALASLLGVGAGRFVVTSGREPVRGELSGSLFEQLVRPIATARGALAATAGAATAGVERISFDAQSLDAYLSATPEPTRTLIRRIAEGASPRKLLLGGDVSPSLLEDVLSDLASRGAIESVRGLGGADLLTPAVEDALALLQGTFRPRDSKPPNGTQGPSSGGSETNASRSKRAAAAASPDADEDATYSVAPEKHDPARSLEDAVMREISDGKTEPTAAGAPAADLPSIVETSGLRRRSSNPPPPVDVASAPRVLASIPPDAVVPAASTSEDPVIAAAAAGRAGETTERIAPKPHLELAPESDVPSDPPPAPPQVPTLPPRTTSFAPPAKPRPSGVIPVLVLLGSILAGILYWAHSEGQNPTAHSDPAPVDSSAPAASTNVPPAASSAPETAAPQHASAPADDDLPPGAEVPPGFGLLEVDAPARTAVRVDGIVAGSGPFVAKVARPGYHEVRVGEAGHDTKHTVEVRAGKRTRIRAAPSP
jgi:CheY-like chemotaxis protein